MNGLSDLLRSLPFEELSLARPDIEALINRFLPKRKRDLQHALEVRLRGGSGSARAIQVAAPGRQAPAAIQPLIADDPASKALEYSVRLNTLRDKHIFQWNTAYRDDQLIFKDMLTKRAAPDDAEERGRAVAGLLEQHAADIFSGASTTSPGPWQQRLTSLSPSRSGACSGSCFS